MAPRKGKHHAESSAGSVAAAGGSQSPATQSESAQLNLSVLRKHDPEVLEIVHVAPYAVVYVFSPEAKAGHWEKNGVEGSFFICRLCENYESSERYKVILLNRRGLDNFTFELRNEDQVEFTDELIIFQDDSYGEVQVHGLWIFSEPAPSSTAHQPRAVTDMLKYCVERLQASKEARARAVQRGPDNAFGDKQENGGVGPLGRQLSLSEIFGQQHGQDDAWGVPNHSPLGEAQSSAQYQQGLTSNPIYAQPQVNAFAVNPLQNAFMPNTPPVQQAQQPLGATLGTQQQHLLGLLQKAKLDHSSVP